MGTIRVVMASTVGKSMGTESLLPEHWPHPDPVPLDDVLREIVALIKRFIILEPEQADACALWVLHTHCHELAQRAPILIINAPTRSCGKTQLQKLVGKLVHRPLEAANATPASIFRSIDKWTPTLLIDEADTFFKQNPELAGIVNSGYEKGGCVLRTVGDDHEPKQFPVYSPKCIAGIALERHLAEATMSRGIVINLRRKMKTESVERLRNLTDEATNLLASKVVRACADKRAEIAAAQPELPEKLSDRAQDNWEPLLAIADCAGQEWSQRARASALALAGQAEALLGTSEELLEHIRDIFAKDGTEKMPSADLIAALIEDDALPWATYNRGRPLSPSQLAKKLSDYGIGPQTIRMAPSGPRSSVKGYYRDQFSDAFKRYLPEPKPPVEKPYVPPPPEAGTPPHAY